MTWWDEDAYVCDPVCMDDFCRNTGQCMWPEAVIGDICDRDRIAQGSNDEPQTA